MLKMLISVPVVMVCATAGTVGLLKLIEKILPNGSTIFQKTSEEINSINKDKK